MFTLLTRLAARQRPEQAHVSGARLTRIGRGAWVADRELVYGRRSRLPLRMVVIEHAPGELTLYSPVSLDDGTLEALNGLGSVTRIIVPNRFHTLFVGRAMDAYPDAELLLPAADGGLLSRFPRRGRHVLQSVRIGDRTELEPVRCRDGLVELVLYHDPAELLAVCDLLFNLQSAIGLQRLVLRLNGVWRKPAQSRLQKMLLLKDHESLAAFYRWAMGKPFSQISMAHGQLIAEDPREKFYQLFGSYGAGGATRVAPGAGSG